LSSASEAPRTLGGESPSCCVAKAQGNVNWKAREWKEWVRSVKRLSDGLVRSAQPLLR